MSLTYLLLPALLLAHPPSECPPAPTCSAPTEQPSRKPQDQAAQPSQRPGQQPGSQHSGISAPPDPPSAPEPLPALPLESEVYSREEIDTAILEAQEALNRMESEFVPTTEHIPE